MLLQQHWDSALQLLHPSPTQAPERWATDEHRGASAASEPGSYTTSSPGSRINDFSGVLFNALIILSVVLTVGLIFFCLCSWFKMIACRLCCPAGEEADEEANRETDQTGRERRRRSRQRRHQVAPARRATLPWMTGAAADLFRYPTPPPSYFESVDRLGMPPTPPPGYSSSARATTSAAAPAASADPPVAVVDAIDCGADDEDKSSEGLATAPAGLGFHRSCPNIRLVAPAQQNSAGPDG